jgi:hypothetical protein
MAQHTPGPWHVDAGDFPSATIRDGTGFGIASLWHWDTGQHTANARLIASAPTLLSAAQQAIRSLNSQRKYLDDDRQAIGHAQDAIDILQQAIDKATS